VPASYGVAIATRPSADSEYGPTRGCRSDFCEKESDEKEIFSEKEITPLSGIRKKKPKSGFQACGVKAFSYAT
jgi:hypothetical protein